MAIRPPSRNCLLLVSFPNICYSVEKEADNHWNRRSDRRAAAEAWIFSAGLADQVFVTRQAVSRWESGETVPGPDTLKLLSRLFNVSINTLLGSPEKLICQCCGMPLEDSILSREPDGTPNQDYCQWCYADGEFAYTDLNTLIDFCAGHMASPAWPEDQVRAYLQATLPTLKHWKHPQ